MAHRSTATLQVRQSQDALVLCVSGELDLAGRDEIEPWVVVAVSVAPRVVLDLGSVTFCSSQGLAMLVACEARARAEHCDLVVVNPSARISQLLGITGLDHLVSSTEACAPSLPSSRPAHRGERWPERTATPSSYDPAPLPSSCARPRSARHGHA